ncbi:trichohyalin-like [Notolabrus celidotus]|uniref:trichohyalin-like n=1 Tax=Notolabrus celidotus TaxID=1203425 RepID=UPI00148F6BD1|nr:trichohyalin-like [Notolabrus celidotus]
MSSRLNSSLISEMEKVKSLIKLTPEERKKEVRRNMFQELRSMEIERRQRVALENMEKLKREREERDKVEESLRRQREKYVEERRMQEVTQREEEERKANEANVLQKAEQDLLKQERLHWRKVMQVEEEEEKSVKRPRYKTSAPKEEQLRRQGEAELCRLPMVGDKVSHDRLTSDLETDKQQGKKKTLINNWVGVQKIDSEPVKEEPHPKSSTYLHFTAKVALKSEGKTDKQAPKPRKTKQWLADRLNVGYWMDKYRDHKDKKVEKRKLKVEEQYAKWAAFKASQASHVSRENDCYIGGFATNRNSILIGLF